MLNPEKDAKAFYGSITPTDFPLIIAFYSLSTNIFLEIVRSFVPETMLFQFVPGSYLNALFHGFIFIVMGSLFLTQVSTNFETKDTQKSADQFRKKVFAAVAFFSYIFETFIALTFLIPISLESINQLGEDFLINILPLNKIIDLEAILFFLFLLLSQVPSMLLFLFLNEKNVYQFLKISQHFVFLSILGSGIFTPTIDCSTQLCFALFSASVYFSIICMHIKRINAKIAGLNALIS